MFNYLHVMWLLWLPRYLHAHCFERRVTTYTGCLLKKEQRLNSSKTDLDFKNRRNTWFLIYTTGKGFPCEIMKHVFQCISKLDSLFGFLSFTPFSIKAPYFRPCFKWISLSWVKWSNFMYLLFKKYIAI